MRSALILIFLTVLRSNAALWYVDKDAVGSNNGTSWANAWQTFSNVIWGVSGVNSGDTLYISGGATSAVYNMTNYVVGGYESVLLIGGASGFSASAGNPITVSTGQDANHNGMVILDGSNLTGSGSTSHIIVVAGGDNVILTGNVGGQTNMMIRGSVGGSDREARKGYFGGSGSGQTLSYIIFSNLNNGIHYSSTPATNLDISHCTFRDIRGDGSISCAGGGSYFDSVRIRQNDIQHNYGVVLSDGGPDGVKFGNGTSIWSNEVRNVPGVVVSGQHPDSFQCAGGGTFCKIYDNLIHAPLNSSFELGTAQRINDLWVYNNLIWMDDTNLIQSGHPSGGECGGEFVSTLAVSNIYIFNNTWVDLQSGFGWEWDKDGSQPTITNFWFVNNLFLNDNRNLINWTVGFGDYINTNVAVGTNLIVDYNLFAKTITNTNNPTNNITVGGTASGNYYIRQAHDRTNTPSFVTYTAYSSVNVFQLSASDSAARLMGTNLSAYFTNDILGAPRGATWSIGAYQGISTSLGQINVSDTLRVGTLIISP